MFGRTRIWETDAQNAKVEADHVSSTRCRNLTYKLLAAPRSEGLPLTFQVQTMQLYGTEKKG